MLSACYLLLLHLLLVAQAVLSLESWAVKIRHHSPDSRAESLAAVHGLNNAGRVEPFAGVYKFTASGPHQAAALSAHPDVEWLSQQIPLRRVKRVVFNDPQYSHQWHLLNSREPGHDVNATGVWARGVTGRGVVIAVVDDGLEHSNTDLAPNYEPLGSYDFNSEDSDPTPHLNDKTDNTHGTRCAGLIAAAANNSVCGVGVAYGGRVSGIRMLDGSVTDIIEAQSFVFRAHVNQVYSCSWGPEDNGRTIEGPGTLAKRALELGTLHGRYGYGNIYVFASGNGGTMNDNCNYDGYANSIYTLTIGAVDELNIMPYYAEPCAAMLAVTYSNGHKRNIVTTDGSNNGGCTQGFSGTSAAAPIAAGMVALMLEIRPCLTWRDVQSIVVYSALVVDRGRADWVENGAGLHHSDQHGFGLMDAYRMTATAAVWPLLPAMITTSIDLETPLQFTVSLTKSFHIDGGSVLSLEYVGVAIAVSHVCRGSLALGLSSPAGTHSTLVTTRRYDKSRDGLDWTLTSARFWGEDPSGVWQLTISDDLSLCPQTTRTTSTVTSCTLTLYGSSLTPQGVADRQRIVADAVAGGWVEPLPCPVINHTYPDIVLPVSAQNSWRLWQKVVLTITVVLVAVVMLHCLLDCLWKRMRQMSRIKAGRTLNNAHQEEAALLLDDYTVAMETPELTVDTSRQEAMETTLDDNTCNSQTDQSNQLPEDGNCADEAISESTQLLAKIT